MRYLKLRPPQNSPARIAQDPNVHKDLEGVSHHPWVNSYRHYYKLSCNYQMKISAINFAVSAGEAALGAVEVAIGFSTANPALVALGTVGMVRGAWGLAANAICGVNAKMAYDSIHYTQMAERLYNRKIHIYREILKEPDLAMPINTIGLEGHEADEERRRHYDFLIETALIDTLSQEEQRFLRCPTRRHIYYDHFENRRDVVLGSAVGYQLGTGAYAAASGATSLLYAYPVRAILTSMVYWHFKREEKRAKGKAVFGSKHSAPYIDKALAAVVHKPASLSLPFEVAAAGNYAYQTAADIGLASLAFATARPIEGALHVLSALGNAGFIGTSFLSVVAELEQGDGIDWKHKAGLFPTRRNQSVWRNSIRSPMIRRAVKRYLPQVPVDRTLFSNKDYLASPAP